MLPTLGWCYLNLSRTGQKAVRTRHYPFEAVFDGFGWKSTIWQKAIKSMSNAPISKWEWKCSQEWSYDMTWYDIWFSWVLHQCFMALEPCVFPHVSVTGLAYHWPWSLFFTLALQARSGKCWRKQFPSSNFADQVQTQWTPSNYHDSRLYPFQSIKIAIVLAKSEIWCFTFAPCSFALTSASCAEHFLAGKVLSQAWGFQAFCCG